MVLTRGPATNLEGGDALPLGHWMVGLEERSALRIVHQLGHEHVERCAAVRGVHLVHEQEGLALHDRRRHLAKAVA